MEDRNDTPMEQGRRWGKGRKKVLWYKMKTWYGGEEALAKEIRRTVPPYLYKDVFVIYNERNLRRQQRSVIEREPLFKGCVFLTCEETGTESLFRRFERVPAVSRLISTGYLSMFPLMEKDAGFLEAISGTDHVVHVSYILREHGDSAHCRVYGPLEYLLDGVEKIRFSSRFAKTHKRLWGEDVVIPLGLLLDVDIGESALYQGAAVVAMPPAADHYTVLEIRKDGTGKNVYWVCETVTLIPRGEDLRQKEEPAAEQGMIPAAG